MVKRNPRNDNNPQNQPPSHKKRNCQQIILVFLLLSGALFLYTQSDAAVSTYFPRVDSNKVPLENATRTSIITKIQQSSPPLCPVDEIFSGTWVNITYDHPFYIPARGEIQQKTCSDFNPTQNIYHTYRWEPEAVRTRGCRFADTLDEDSYCRIMKNKTVAIVGDSISYDHFLSLSHLLGVPQVLPKAMKKTALQISHVCHNTSRLIGKRDFYLHSVQDITNEFFPDVLILNRGAHYTSDEELLQDLNTTTFRHVQDWQTRCQQQQQQQLMDDNHKKCLFIWRTTTPGHPDCQNFTQPSTSVAQMEYLVQSHSLSRGNHWDQFFGQNKLVLETLKQHANLSYEIMDGYYVNILRPDLHKRGDCLHTVRVFEFIYSTSVYWLAFFISWCIYSYVKNETGSTYNMKCLPDDNTYSSLLYHMLLLKYDTPQ